MATVEMEPQSGPERRMVPLTEFDGITVDAVRYAAVADRYDSLALGLSALMRDQGLEGLTRVDQPMRTAMAELNGVIASAGGMCTRSPPPRAIATVMDAGGRLIYQCAHARLHRWDLDGTPLPPGAP